MFVSFEIIYIIYLFMPTDLCLFHLNVNNSYIYYKTIIASDKLWIGRHNQFDLPLP